MPIRALFICLLLIVNASAQAVERSADRASSVLAELSKWNAPLSAADRQTKYCKMSESVYAFYRGTNHLFWKDFANDARLTKFGNKHTRTWLQGDLHAYNFGAYDNSQGEIVYGLNDFDESMVEDYQYDLWRMAISLVLIARENGDLDRQQQEKMLDAFSEAYLDAMASYHHNDQEQKLTFTESNTYGKLNDFLHKTKKDNSRAKLLDKWTQNQNGQRKFALSSAKLSAVSQEQYQQIVAAMPAYGHTLSGKLTYSAAYFQVKDISQRLLAGTGSLGTARFYVLIEGASSSPDDDRILDVKLQTKPTPYAYLGDSAEVEYKANFLHPAQLHAMAYSALTQNTDEHLGWMQLSDGNYSVREYSPYKEAFPTEDLNSDTRFNKLAEQWGKILATAHAAADKDFSSAFVPYSVDKEIDIATEGLHKEFNALVRALAFDYADQVEYDRSVFLEQLANCP